MKILVMGVTGMLGSTVFKFFSENTVHDVYGTLRRKSGLTFFDKKHHLKLIPEVDVLEERSLSLIIEKIKPDIVINCIGLIKQISNVNDPLLVLPINAMFPHNLAKLCSVSNARLILISTDCVFSGSKGMYVESDVSNAEDLYGKSKYIGEVNNLPHVVTLRTSIIGHELNSIFSLVDWFLSQSGSVKGYSQAIFSGLPTIELARVIYDYVITEPQLNGLYHVSVKPIDKLSLLKIIAETYNKDIKIIQDNKVNIDRSLNSDLFRNITGYNPPEWSDLINLMYEFR